MYSSSIPYRHETQLVMRSRACPGPFSDGPGRSQLEVVLQRELDDACIRRSADLTVQRAGENGVGVGEIDVVEEVEELGAELEVRLLPGRDVLEVGEVGVDQPRSDQGVPAGVAIGYTGGNLREGSRVEE